MAVDLNQAEEQGIVSDPIPEDSVVIVVAEVRSPKAGREGTAHPLFSRSSSGYEYLDFEFIVASPKFKDRKIWQNYMLAFNGAPTEKSNQAISISMRTLRAMVESARKIQPKDASPAATKARIINDFSDLTGMLFPVVVGCEWGRPNEGGKRYLNNTIKRIVTPDDERFAKVFADPEGVILSDKPLPPEPAAASTAAMDKPAWTTTASTAKAEPATGTLPGVKTTGKPSWVK